jgi:hypothetical protein
MGKLFSSAALAAASLTMIACAHTAPPPVAAEPDPIETTFTSEGLALAQQPAPPAAQDAPPRGTKLVETKTIGGGGAYDGANARSVAPQGARPTNYFAAPRYGRVGGAARIRWVPPVGYGGGSAAPAVGGNWPTPHNYGPATLK